jgi:hypothetical protein
MGADDLIKILVPGLSALFGMGTFYGIVRADFRHMVETVGRIDKDVARIEKNADKAHERIDNHITNYHKD